MIHPSLVISHPLASHTMAILLGGLLLAVPSTAKATQSPLSLGESSQVTPDSLALGSLASDDSWAGLGDGLNGGLNGEELALDALDPANNVEPPGLDIRSGNAAISPYLDRAMQDELKHLMGRFEGALLQGYASTQPTELALTSIRTEGSLNASLGAASLATPLTHPALETAQQTLSDWPELIARRDYGTARRRWIEARQGLWNAFPVEQSLAQPEIRAMWLDRGTIVRARSEANLAQVFDRLAAAGINTVFFETINAGYPIYPSRIAPQQNPLTRHWDPLASAVKLGKERGIEVHAWVWLFAAGNRRHNHLLNLPANYPGPLLNANPGWAAYDRQGRAIPVGQDKPFLDPANPEVRSYLMRMLQELANNYDVDGIHFDYVRYPFQDPAADQTYGYGTAARLRFRDMNGIDPALLSPRNNPSLSSQEQRRQQQLWQLWTEFRVEQVSSFVAEASQMLRQQQPDLTISAAVFAKPTHERVQKIQQDWETWAKRGDVDWIVLMSYAMDTKRFEDLIRPWILEADYGSTLIIPGIRLLNLPEMAALDQIQTLRDLPVSGYALFAVDNLQRGIQTLLNNTQGEAGLSPSIPQQQPFNTATERYQALQREWSWLLSNGQILMREEKMAQWVSDVNALGDQLADLAADPSHRKLEQVRSQLTELERVITTELSVKSQQNQYRLQAWEHRLTTIEHLLAYGEQRFIP
ncbi:glycoside hydrolase family 10 protein [Leptothoe sp. PORK10 BA2]|uniref:glycoside hydrolase family 10 protein n=1 Tax=Leptothoe sp. PORK10 BA2 TaxID=3110254 RepID=UPI002B1FBD80|nr:family 10 glycosylhydrolase [Leptothoe sp. PORK10 BA2]MEA5463491.1 family 10 glycosylhydrolase [Leptothoe sp. PORK10 BA2]